MPDNHIVIGGWALPPKLLQECFGPDYSYIDCNPIMPSLFNKEFQLDKNWPVLLREHLSLSENEPYHLAGWSTGAIMAFALSTLLPTVSLTLISPTLSFCRRDGHRSGARPSVLRTMREHLLLDSHDVLSQFHHSCGLPATIHSSLPYSIEELTSGLHFLEQVDCTKTEHFFSEALLIHGSDDAIIPHKSAEIVANRCGGTLHTLAGSHAVFYGNETLITKYIKEYTTEGKSS